MAPRAPASSAEESERLLGGGSEAGSSTAAVVAAVDDASQSAQQQPAEPAAAGSPVASTSAPAADAAGSARKLQPGPAVLVIPASAAPLGATGGGKAVRPGHTRSSSVDSDSSSHGDSSALLSSKSKEQTLCRICLEEDALSNLEAPCGCTGTQKYAHHSCIQRWIDEKGHLRCEICEQPYRGEYTVPPPGPPLDDLTMFSPLFIRVDGETGPGQHHDRTLDFLDESDHYYQRNPAASWCFTFVIFVFFLVVLHHTMLVADGMDVDGGDSGPGGMSPSGASPSSGGGEGPGADDYATSLTLLLFWIGTKAFLIGIPLYTVMRIAARQARREQYEAMLRSGALDAAARNVLYRIRARQDALAAGSGAAAAGGSGGRAAPAAAAAPVAAGTV